MVPLREFGCYLYMAILHGYVAGFLRTRRWKFRPDYEKRQYRPCHDKPICREMVVESLRLLSEQQVRRRSGDHRHQYVTGRSRNTIPSIRMGFFPFDGGYSSPTVKVPGGK